MEQPHDLDGPYADSGAGRFVLQRVGSEDADGEGRRRSGSPTTLKDVFNLVGSGRLKYL